LISFQGGAAPAQTAHLPLFQRHRAGERCRQRWPVLHGRLPPPPERRGIDGSRLRSAPPSTPQRQAAVKLHRVFFPRWESVDCSPTLRGFTGLQAGDSGALVDPFMHVGTYPTRHLATLRESELLPAFTGPYTGWTRLSGTRTGQDSIAVQNLSVWRLPMFLLNSQDPLVTAT
jgi:hypothetical protein